ncbi:hypothetical protein MVLG_01956 [Microbotryum lychnidis-dioicae p1A1 Lamole]|uniref:Uncharacterized protein n=1 Tax=Microbotryum lychnidis-dioicae (strain p1A1 Lamole / MvSl-1064) TaxID=683840 RepID=U5H3P5_USTV1|nr:hypothetical protein MVLG_01956 [Microbotryum lychnidis-dioicae p1A1 Lamole]|eukprot:KDE07862.1 hypothetical protein MVLG_01956 [Microbotryum lychnidis-dioicae p1A1 Lamole]
MASSSRRPPSSPDTHPTTINQRRFRKSRSRSMKTLSSLPPEIVRQIVGEVDLIVAQERSGLGMLSSMGLFPADVSLDDVIDAGPAAFFGMLAGFLGTGAGDNPLGANGAAPGAGPNAATAAPATTTNATTTPTTAATTASASASTATTNPARSNAPAASTSTIPSTPRQANANATASNRTGTTASAAPSTSASMSTSRTSANPSSSTARAPAGSRSGSQPSTNTNRGTANAGDITITRAYSLSRDSLSGEWETDEENEPCTCPSCFFERMLAFPGFENEGINLDDPTSMMGPTRGYDDDADPSDQPIVSEDDYDSEFDNDQDDDDDEFDEDEYDDDEEYDDDDNDGSDSDVTDSDPRYYGPPRPYSNGLPLDPLVPLLFVNRTFLHASRAKLYCKITITGAWHGSLLLRSLQAPEHAARTAVEDFDELPKNYLATYVRHIHFNAKGDVSLGRGGGQIIVDILKLCTRLQSLTIAPTFLAHARRPLLKALRGLNELKQVSLSSSNDPDVPMLFTTPRISHLMNTAWRELEELTVHGLRPSLDGTIDEEHCMWTELGQNFGMEDAKEHAAVSMACRAANLATNVEALREKLGRHLPEGPKPRGLTALKLTHPLAPATEWSHILQYSSDTLKILDIVHPFASVTPQGLASTLLTFGVNLTHLSIDVESTWIADTRDSSLLTRDEPRRTSGKGPPPRPKDYVNGRPTAQVVNGIAKYPFLLDAIVPYLRNLKNLSWTGRLASPPMFFSFPPSLSVLAWSQCSSIQPGRLTRILKKRVTRSRNDADGLQGLSAQVAPGLTCISVTDDDVDWDADETDLLDAELKERNVCLHLSSMGPTMARGRGVGAGAGAGGANGAFGFGFGVGIGGNANRNGGGAAGAAPPAVANAAPGGAAVAAAVPQPLAGAGGAAGATTDAGARRVRPRTNAPTTTPTTTTTATATAATTANGTGAGAGTATVTGTGTATNTSGFPPRQPPQNPALGNFTPVSGVGTTGTGLRVAPVSMPRNVNGNRAPNSTTTATRFPPDFFRFNPHLPAATAAGLGSTTSTALGTTSTSTASTSATSTSTAPIFGASASTSTPGQPTDRAPMFRFQF